ncbi:hypothetical protein [Romboutsia lituseburensis]|uniref:hypothetical protein n=1 Tax=Romboutsia lituseburensis TaxID=1537 RepID=UPI0022EA819D|nr:hypothetical protein [Romboutsia lituseburensis]
MFIDEVKLLTEESKNNKYANALIQIKNNIIESAKNGLNSTTCQVSNSCTDIIINQLESELFLCKLHEKLEEKQKTNLTISW